MVGEHEAEAEADRLAPRPTILPRGGLAAARTRFDIPPKSAVVLTGIAVNP